MRADEGCETMGACGRADFEELAVLFDRGRAEALSSSCAKLLTDLELEMDLVCELIDAADVAFLSRLDSWASFVCEEGRACD